MKQKLNGSRSQRSHSKLDNINNTMKETLKTISNTFYGHIDREGKSERNRIQIDPRDNENVYKNISNRQENSYKNSLANIDYGKRSRVSRLAKGKISCDKNCSLECPKQNFRIINNERRTSSGRRYLNPCRSIEANRAHNYVCPNNINESLNNKLSLKVLPSSYKPIEIVKNETGSTTHKNKKLKLKKDFAESGLTSKLMLSKLNLQKWKEFLKERDGNTKGNKNPIRSQ